MSAADGAGGYKMCRLALAKAEARVAELEESLGAVLSWIVPKGSGYVIDGTLSPSIYEQARATLRSSDSVSNTQDLKGDADGRAGVDEVREVAGVQSVQRERRAHRPEDEVAGGVPVVQDGAREGDQERAVVPPPADEGRAAGVSVPRTSEARPRGGPRACIPGERCPHVDGADRCRLPAGHELTGWYDGHEFDQRTNEAQAKIVETYGDTFRRLAEHDQRTPEAQTERADEGEPSPAFKPGDAVRVVHGRYKGRSTTIVNGPSWHPDGLWLYTVDGCDGYVSEGVLRSDKASPRMPTTPETWGDEDEHAETARRLMAILPHRDEDEAERLLADVFRQVAGKRSANAQPAQPGDPTVRHVVAWMRATYPQNAHAQEWANEIEHVFLGRRHEVEARPAGPCPRCSSSTVRAYHENGAICPRSAEPEHGSFVSVLESDLDRVKVALGLDPTHDGIAQVIAVLEKRTETPVRTYKAGVENALFEVQYEMHMSTPDLGRVVRRLQELLEKAEER